MLTLFQINGTDYNFGAIPDEAIATIVIRTSGLPIPVLSANISLIKSYLKSLVNNLREDGYVIYNSVLIYKNDININI